MLSFNSNICSFLLEDGIGIKGMGEECNKNPGYNRTIEVCKVKKDRKENFPIE